MNFNPQAEELNMIIKRYNPVLYELLSTKGKAIFFPKKGILGQTAEATETKLNATIGIALEEDGTPMRLPSIANKITLPPREIFPYASSYGVAKLRTKWKEEIYRKNPSLKTEITLPLPTSGITQALSIAGYLVVNPGDKIILPEPYWGNYKLIYEQGYGAMLDPFPLFANDTFNVKGLQQRLKSGKNIMVFNFPNNPTGYTATVEEAREIAMTLRKHAEKGNRIVAIIDDAYFGFVYDNEIFKESLFSLLADLHKNILAMKVDGATKEEFSWGLRVGFITLATRDLHPETRVALEDKIAGVVRSTVSNVSHLAQSLILHALDSKDHNQEVQKKCGILQKRFLVMKRILAEKEYQHYFSALPCNSGYFMCLQLNPGLDAEKVRKTLLRKYSTGVIATAGLLRIAYSGIPAKNLRSLIENIHNACQEQKH